MARDETRLDSRLRGAWQTLAAPSGAMTPSIEGAVMRTRLLAVAAVLVSLVAVVADCGASSATATPTAATFTATSTLDGKTVLPRHIRWIAETTMPASQVAQVSFQIDGKTYWTETAPPYVYSGNQGTKHLGYLVTTWLKPGRHRFTVQIKAKSGHTAVDSVKARVLPAPEVPTALSGTWQRTLANPVPPDAGSDASQPNPAGTYTITFTRRWIQDHYPGTYNKNNSTCIGCILDDDYLPGTKTFRVWGAVTIAPESTWAAEGGWWCYPEGPATTYSWSVSGNTLTLAPVGGHDGCGQRGKTWTGTWTRVH
jgi:hypothetical protein